MKLPIKESKVKSQKLVIYTWLTGQDDNIGDSVLRRAYADELRSRHAIRVWGGDPASGYITGLGLQAGELDERLIRWYASFTRDSILGRAGFAYNAGEFTVTKATFLRFIPLLPGILILKLRRAPLIWMGAEVKSTQRGLTWPFRWFARISNHLSWRERTSSARLGAPAPVVPDWAFSIRGEGSETGVEGRPYLAVSVRGDRSAPSEKWLKAVDDLAARLGLSVRVVIQVRRDQETGRRSAAQMVWEIQDWESDDHDVQEALVRSAYARSSVIVSDRLHALVMAATEGAVPLAWTQDESDKVRRHFAVIGIEDVVASGDDAIRLLDAADADAIDARSRALDSSLGKAQATIASAFTTSPAGKAPSLSHVNE